MNNEQYQFRKLMGRFVTGVSVIATHNEDQEVIAMTANAITAVSLDPMLLLVCVRNESRLLPYLLNNQGFSVNLLHASQDHISRHYGGQKNLQTENHWVNSEQNIPLLSEANASFICTKHSTYQAGDHTVIFGEVQEMHAKGDPEPALVFAAGQYHELALAT